MDCMNRYGWCVLVCVCVCVCVCVWEGLKNADVNKTEQLAGEGGEEVEKQRGVCICGRVHVQVTLM